MSAPSSSRARDRQRAAPRKKLRLQQLGGEAPFGPLQKGRSRPSSIFTRKRKRKRNARKERVIDRINAPVLGAAKRVLNGLQERGGYSSQGDALSDLLLDYERLQERVKELEALLSNEK